MDEDTLTGAWFGALMQSEEGARATSTALQQVATEAQVKTARATERAARAAMLAAVAAGLSAAAALGSPLLFWLLSVD